MPQPQLQGNTTLEQPQTQAAQPSQQPLPFPTAKTDPLKEYVAGGPLSYLQDYYRALPQYIDDVTIDFGPETYDRMLKDSQVASAFESLRMGVLANGISFPGRIQDEEDQDFELSQEVRDFVERNLTERLDQPFRQICYDMLEGMASGHKVSELVYEYETDNTDEDAGKICLKAIKVKPQRATAFVVDAFYNVVAIIAVLPGGGMGSTISQGVIAISTAQGQAQTALPNLLPREKFAVFTYRPQDSDPRGTSILRPAFDPWWCKVQVKKDYLAYMARFASPSLIGYTPEDAQSYPVTDSYANLTPDENNVQQYLSPEQSMGAALAGWKNAYYIVLTGGSKVDVVQATGDGSAFTRAFDFYNAEITKGIQYQTLSTNEGQHQSRAASQTHENVKDMVINFAKEALTDCINLDIIYNLVRYNYGEDVARRLSPKISFSAGAAQDFADDAGAVAGLQSAGYLHPSQLPALDSRLGLPPRDFEAQMQDIADQKAMQMQQAGPADAVPEEEGPDPNQLPLADAVKSAGFTTDDIQNLVDLGILEPGYLDLDLEGGDTSSFSSSDDEVKFWKHGGGMGASSGLGGHGVQHPGSRGGHPWTDDHGNVRYGPKPTGTGSHGHAGTTSHKPQRAVKTGVGGGSGKAKVGELRAGYRIKRQTVAQKHQAKKRMLSELDKVFKTGVDPHGNKLNAKTLDQISFLATSLRTELHSR